MGTFSNIVVAIDGSEPSHRAIAFALALTSAEKARLSFCNAVDVMAACTPIAVGGPMYTASALAALESGARAFGADALAHAAAAGVPATSTVLRGTAAHAIEE